MSKLLQKENKVLRQKSQEVPVSDIKSKKIQNIIKEMKAALDSQKDGVAIAAPQIGYLVRIFVVSGKVPKIIEMTKDESKRSEISIENIKKESADEVFINPKISKYSREKELMDEGCLSVRWFYGKVKRSKKVSLEALNEKGETVKKGASGLLAQIFQHETDHLDGTLFIDKAVELEEIKPEETIDN